MRVREMLQYERENKISIFMFIAHEQLGYIQPYCSQLLKKFRYSCTSKAMFSFPNY